MGTEVTDVNDNVESDEDQIDAPEAETSTSEVSELESLKQQLADALADSAKQRAIKQSLSKERDSLKNQKPTDDSAKTDKKYRDLWEKSQKELEDIRTKSNESLLNAALSDQLVKQGVKSDAILAAKKLIDRNMVEFNDDGIDSMSVLGAIQALKAESGFLFESKVKPSTTRQPAAKQVGDKEVSRDVFEKLPHSERAALIKAGTKVV